MRGYLCILTYPDNQCARKQTLSHLVRHRGCLHNMLFVFNKYCFDIHAKC